MKAYVLHGIDDLKYDEVSVPDIGSNEVLVKVDAAGICGSDIPRIYKTGTYSYPLIPGHEFSGEVIEVGSDVENEWKRKRVGIFPLIPCKKCIPCQNKQYELCRHYSYLGSRTNGGFAEYVAVPEWNLIELPQNVTYEQAAMLEPMAVAIHAMRRACKGNEDNNRKIVVYGLGTIGILLAMYLKEADFSNVFVIGNKEFQRKMVKNLGINANCFCDSRKYNVYEWIMSQTNNRGADIIFECVGRNDTINDAIMCAAPGATVQLIGNPASDISFERNIYWKILRNQLTVLGSWNSSFYHGIQDDWHYALNKLQQERIHPEQFITHKLSLEELEQGLHIMRDKMEEYVKVMMVNNF